MHQFLAYFFYSNDRPILFLIRSPYVDKQHFSITYLHPTNIGEEATQVIFELFKCDEKGFMNLVKCFRPIRLLYYYIFLLICKLQIPRTVLVHVCKQWSEVGSWGWAEYCVGRSCLILEPNHSLSTVWVALAHSTVRFLTCLAAFPLQQSYPSIVKIWHSSYQL